jgi:hypothetical protein
MSKTRSNRKKKRAYTRKHYQSNDGMLTSVWGPSAWHFLHTLSFNYPVNPSCDDKRHYREYVLSLRHVLPCGKCRKNLCKNFNRHPLLYKHMQNRTTFSKYIYKLHEVVNEMLGKKSGLSYEDVRDRYEHFRSRCRVSQKQRDVHEEKGCTEPVYGEKSKCVLQIVPQTTRCDTFQIDEKCKNKLV